MTVDVNLRCVDEQAAQQCAAFLRDMGITHVETDGQHVKTALTVGSVIRLAEDALANGWAHDDDAARIIAEMG